MSSEGKAGNHRYSIIPARAVTDPNITPWAFRVLALLGRHTDNNGWCRRSQVKMALELGCGRATIYRALNELMGLAQEDDPPDMVRFRYIERREETRPNVRHEEGRQPHCAYSYRVRLDLEDDGEVPASGQGVVPASGEGVVPASEQGVPAQSGQGVPTLRAPLIEPSLCEPSPCEHTRAAVWPAFLKWPGLPNSASEFKTLAALDRLANPPPLGEMLACIEAEGLARAQTARARGGNAEFGTAPHNWLERDRGWEKHLSEVRAQRARIAAGVERAAQVLSTLGAEVHAKLRRARMNEGEIAILAGAEFDPGPPACFWGLTLQQETVLRKHHPALHEILPGVVFERASKRRSA